MIKDLTPQEIDEFVSHFPEHPRPDCLIRSEYEWWYGVKALEAKRNFWERATNRSQGEALEDGAVYIKRGGGAMIHIAYNEWQTWPTHWFKDRRGDNVTYINRNGEIQWK